MRRTLLLRFSSWLFMLLAISLSSLQAMAAELTEQQARITAAWWVHGSIFEEMSESQGTDGAWDAYRRSPNPSFSKMMNAKTKELLGHIDQALFMVRGDTGYCGKINEPTWVISGDKEFLDLNGGNPVMINARTGKVVDCRS